MLMITKNGKKVKVTPVQALRLCTGHTARRGSRGTALPFHDHGTRRGWGVRVMRPTLYHRERPGTHCTGGWVGSGAGLDGCWKPPPPVWFDFQTIQPVASCNTDYATRPTHEEWHIYIWAWQGIVYWNTWSSCLVVSIRKIIPKFFIFCWPCISI